jgi:predicted kinase
LSRLHDPDIDPVSYCDAKMTTSQPTLYLLCGKIAAGKSTLASRLASRPATVLISEDYWNSSLFPGELKTIEDYSRYSRRVRDTMGPHVVSLLKAGMSVVLDFHANTLASRSWMRGIFEQANAAHELHFLDVSDQTCKRRLLTRNSAGEHPYQVSDSDYEIFTSYFVPPTPDEGFNVVVHKE